MSTDFSELFYLSLPQLGKIANKIVENKCGKTVTFVIDATINYTNICVSKCKFCAFYAKDQGFILSQQQIIEKVAKAAKMGATQIMLQGGMNPELNIEWFENVFSKIKKLFPQIHLHSLSPPEIVFLSKLEGLSYEEVLLRLKNAGLDSLPGGGAEILVDSVRQKISPKKCNAGEWLEVMRTAHRLGIPTTATMVFGHLENEENIIEHLLKIKDLQNETKGFIAFIPWTFHPGNTELDFIPKVGATKYLKVLAISRIVLDNFRNIQASWLSQGFEIAKLSLFFGANDFGGTLLEESVIRATGKDFKPAKVEEIVNAIKSVGKIPARRDTYYRILEYY
ncbi:MAG: cyclic dehypoxanthinyl futalosine synthase [Archaeoglobaceae archaeon]|nr:dehypoxanthine futalosine cyclase [Archaeoglobaceae archaeon]MDW7990312.1 cyclic dehypoxanthinyl futalosine synthase [Archaeoglobaceae archaeon]